MPTVHIIVKGKVQAVFYRATAKEIAGKLSVTGWIKNTPDGNVEAMATGTREQLQEFIDWCRQGPAKAKVISLTATDVEETIFEDFSINRR